MVLQLTDVGIDALIQEPKKVPSDFQKKIRLKSKRGHKEFEMMITGEENSRFRFIVRQSLVNPLDFSVILVYESDTSNQQFRLCRYNGKSHHHTNKIENQTINGFHIHKATERYQNSGFREDAYAEETDRYVDYHGAIECMIRDCHFILDEKNQSLTSWGVGT